MRRYKQSQDKSKRLFVGIELRKLRWHMTVRTEDAEVFICGIPRDPIP